MNEREREHLNQDEEMRAREAEFHQRESTQGKSQHELESDIDAIRRDMDLTLNELERRFSPGDVVDRFIAYLRENPGEYFTNLGMTVRNNPVPTTLVGIGLSWLAITGTQSGREHPWKERAREKRGELSRKFDEKRQQMHEGKASATERMHQGSEKVRGKVHQGTESFRESIHQASEKMHAMGGRVREVRRSGSDRMHSMRDRARHMRESTGERMHTMGDRARHMRESAGEWSHRMSEAGHRSGDRARRMRSSVSEMIHEQPLLLGLFGIAAGALLGAMLPKTREEERWLGETGQRMKERAVREGRDMAQEAVERAEDLAHTAVHKTEEEISRQLH